MKDAHTTYSIDDQKTTSSEGCDVQVDFDPFAPQFLADPFAIMDSVRHCVRRAHAGMALCTILPTVRNSKRAMPTFRRW
jgi:hypothetical protein